MKTKIVTQKIIPIFFVLFSFIIFSSETTLAHPGRTASDGCHYCRTNCDSWGETWNARHCHGGYSPPAPSYSQPSYSPSCPANSTYSSSKDSCTCNFGYEPSLNMKYCVKIPDNAHAVNSKTDVWLCDDGYKESGNSCVKKESCENDGYQTTITRIVDGDTVEFVCDGKKEKIRIIGIDTPETVHPSKPVECFGKNATEKMNKLAQGKPATLYKGQGTDNRDKYGRLLRYINVDGRDIGATMIRDGFAFSYKTYPHEKLDEYNNLEIEAKEKENGLWAKDVCDYQDKTNDSSTAQEITKQKTVNNESLIIWLVNFLKAIFK